MRYESRFLYKNGKRLFSSNDIDRAFSKKRKIFTFSNGTIRGFSNKSGKQYGTVNDFKKFSIQRKTKNGTVRYSTVRYEKGTVTNSDALLYLILNTPNSDWFTFKIQ